MSTIKNHPLFNLGSSTEDNTTDTPEPVKTIKNSSPKPSPKPSPKLSPKPNLKPSPKPKRQAPKISDATTLKGSVASNVSETTSLNMLQFIDIDQVRWFYKKHKDLTTSSSSNNINKQNDSINSPSTEATPRTATPDRESVRSTSPFSNDNTSDIKNIPNIDHSTIIQSSEWSIFNKLDSFNLEMEYRAVQQIKQEKSTNNNSERKLIQVLDNLYEVNLQTKVCLPIYWKGN
jgi:hypothetical protein